MRRTRLFALNLSRHFHGLFNVLKEQNAFFFSVMLENYRSSETSTGACNLNDGRRLEKRNSAYPQFKRLTWSLLLVCPSLPVPKLTWTPQFLPLSLALYQLIWPPESQKGLPGVCCFLANCTDQFGDQKGRTANLHIKKLPFKKHCTVERASNSQCSNSMRLNCQAPP